MGTLFFAVDFAQQDRRKPFKNAVRPFKNDVSKNRMELDSKLFFFFQNKKEISKKLPKSIDLW
jgi:hypothetical protein